MLGAGVCEAVGAALVDGAVPAAGAAGAVGIAACSAVLALSEDFSEDGNHPSMAAVPTRLATMTAAAAMATIGWIFADEVLMTDSL